MIDLPDGLSDFEVVDHHVKLSPQPTICMIASRQRRATAARTTRPIPMASAMEIGFIAICSPHHLFRNPDHLDARRGPFCLIRAEIIPGHGNGFVLPRL